MSTLYITTKELGAKLRAEGGKSRKCVDLAIKRAVDKWVVWLPEYIDKLGVTHTGGYRDGFRVTTTAGRVAVDNDHPAAGVLENGCAPHPVSEAGQESIKRWCIEKLGLSDKEASSAAFLICRKIREFGQEAKFIVRNALPKLIVFYKHELARALKSEAA